MKKKEDHSVGDTVVYSVKYRSRDKQTKYTLHFDVVVKEVQSHYGKNFYLIEPVTGKGHMLTNKVSSK